MGPRTGAVRWTTRYPPVTTRTEPTTRRWGVWEEIPSERGGRSRNPDPGRGARGLNRVCPFVSPGVATCRGDKFSFSYPVPTRCRTPLPSGALEQGRDFPRNNTDLVRTGLGVDYCLGNFGDVSPVCRVRSSPGRTPTPPPRSTTGLIGRRDHRLLCDWSHPSPRTGDLSTPVDPSQSPNPKETVNHLPEHKGKEWGVTPTHSYSTHSPEGRLHSPGLLVDGKTCWSPFCVNSPGMSEVRSRNVKTRNFCCLHVLQQTLQAVRHRPVSRRFRLRH